MAGIYIHIPFCRKACHYCNFHFSTSIQSVNKMIEAISKEARLAAPFLNDQPVTTIYFGGGTPSLLEATQLHQILSSIQQHYRVQPHAEFTLEANPDDITSEKLQSWKQNGINRLSIGIQSFFDEDLLWMNRAHNATQAYSAIQLAQAANFDNITIDLIYGTPGLTDERWKQNVQIAIDLGCNHISSYALTVEAGTGLAHSIKKGALPDIDTEQQARQFLLLIDWLTAAGYEHYEISNFAKPGHRGQHNSSYWQGATYLGLGPAAHSFDGEIRRWNIANNARYVHTLATDIIPFETEKLTPIQQLNEYTMTALRTMEGLSLHNVEKKWGKSFSEQLEKQSIPFQLRGWLTQENQHLILTKEGKLFADGIAADLFFS